MRKIIVTGGSGFVGQHLVRVLVEKGYEAVIFDVAPPRKLQQEHVPNVIFHQIDLARTKPTPDLIRDAEATIHLAGKSIFQKWSKKVKKEIYESRVRSAKNLVRGIRDFPNNKQQVFISASAVGFYGDGGEEELDESSPQGDGFLAQLCADWEEEAGKAGPLGMRVVQVRTASVLGRGGWFDQVLGLYRWGFGGQIGNGRQWFPWIHIADLVNIYMFALVNDRLEGPVNAAAPHHVQQKKFSKMLARTVRRPAFVRAPEFALRWRYGEFAEAMVASQKVKPRKLGVAGYEFRFPELGGALENIVYGTNRHDRPFDQTV